MRCPTDSELIIILLFPWLIALVMALPGLIYTIIKIIKKLYHYVFIQSNTDTNQNKTRY